MKLINRIAQWSLVLLFFAFISCKKEDEKPTNHFSYKGKSYAVTNVGISDFLTFPLFENNPTHTGYFIGLSDGDFTVTGEEDFKASYFLTFVMYFPTSSEAQEPQEGLYQCISLENLYKDPEGAVGKNMVTSVGISLDENGDGILDYDETDYTSDLTEGTVRISGSGTRFSFELNLKDADGSSLTGNYSGEVAIGEFD